MKKVPCICGRNRRAIAIVFCQAMFTLLSAPGMRKLFALNARPNSFSRGHPLWHVAHAKPYCRAKNGVHEPAHGSEHAHVSIYVYYGGFVPAGIVRWFQETFPEADVSGAADPTS